MNPDKRTPKRTGRNRKGSDTFLTTFPLSRPMKIVGGRKFALNKHDRSMVIRKRPRAIVPVSHRSKRHWM
jgi:hypothetical protein